MAATTVEQRFMQQQGFPAEEPTKLPSHFRALRFQPSIAGPLMLLGIIIQARTQWSLVCTAFNLRKMYKAWGGGEGLAVGRPPNGRERMRASPERVAGVLSHRAWA